MPDQYGQIPTPSPDQQPAAMPPQPQPQQATGNDAYPTQIPPQPSLYAPPQHPIPPELSAPQGLPSPQYWTPQAPPHGQNQYEQSQLPQHAPQHGQPEVSPQLPPYGAPQYGTTQTPHDPQFAAPPQAPFATTAPPPTQPKKRNLGLVLTLIVSGVLVAAAAATTVIVLSTSANSAKPEAPTASEAPKAPETPKAPEAPKASETPKASDNDSNTDSSERTFGPDDPEIGGTGPIQDRLEAFQAELKQSSDDGTLWQKIPQTKENSGALIALQFILTDMKSATRFGAVSDEQATQWAKEAKFLESQLLAQKPLGTSVHYVLSDGKVFDYNGDTGEVRLEDPEQ